MFGYIFGLFLIFVIIWFIWYGTSLKRRHHYNRRNHQQLHHNHHLETYRNTSASGHPLSQYDYSVQSSLSRPLAQHNTYGLNNQIESNYSPMGLRTNPAFNSKDEIGLYHGNQHNTIINSASGHNINTQQANQFIIADDLSSSHSASFVHTYQHRIWFCSLFYFNFVSFECLLKLVKFSISFLYFFFCKFESFKRSIICSNQFCFLYDSQILSNIFEQI